MLLKKNNSRVKKFHISSSENFILWILKIHIILPLIYESVSHIYTNLRHEKNTASGKGFIATALPRSKT
jgi:hypothetical protein